MDLFLEKGLTTNLVDFLSEEWAEAFCHPAFPDFVATLRKLEQNVSEKYLNLEIELRKKRERSIKEAMIFFLSERQEFLQSYCLPETHRKMF